MFALTVTRTLTNNITTEQRTPVFKLPKTSYNNCKGSKWRRTAMIRERKVLDGTETLSIRGDEETFMGSLATKGNLNLLVPE